MTSAVSRQVPSGTRRAARAYPFLAALFPPLALYAHNQRFYKLPDLLLAMASSLLVAGVLWLISFALWRDADRRAYSLFVLLLCFHLAGHAGAYAGAMPMLLLGQETDLGTIAMWTVAFLGAGLLFCRLPAEWKTVTRALSLFSLILVAIPLARIPKLELERLARKDLDFQGGHWSVVRPVSATKTPHIFYVVLDSYGRQDALASYGFDNTPFLDALRQRGFYVATHSESPHSGTVGSLASSLNMSYRDARSRGMESDEDLWSENAAINHNRVARMLRERGYAFAAFANGFEMTEARMADVFLDIGPTWKLDGKFFQTAMDLTALRVLAGRFSMGQKKIKGLHRARVLFTLERAPKLAGSRGPVFAFVHVVCPHFPYVFDAQGNEAPPITDRRRWSPQKKHAYIEQVKFVNGRVLRMVDEILATSTRPVVIVLQGDHGVGVVSPKGMDSDRLKILNAYLFPDRQYQKLSDAISPVNTFRIVLSQYLGFDIPLLPNRRAVTSVPVVESGLADDLE